VGAQFVAQGVVNIVALEQCVELGYEFGAVQLLAPSAAASRWERK
jgi:hypothetical protein